MTNKEHIEQLFKAHYREMFGMAMLLLHDEAESKDAVSEVFAMLLGRNDVDLRANTARAYLLRSVRNHCLNLMRNRTLQQRILRLYQLDMATDIMPWESRQAEIDELRQVIATHLSGEERHILTQRFQLQMKYREIADEENVSEVAVYKRLAKALAILREYYRKEHGNG